MQAARNRPLQILRFSQMPLCSMNATTIPSVDNAVNKV